MLFQIILAKTSDQKLGIPSNIYLLILSSELNDFFIRMAELDLNMQSNFQDGHK